MTFTLFFTSIVVIATILTVPDLVHAFSFNFTTPPAQCSNATVQWSGGKAPFHLLLIPTGALHPEVRVIADHTITSGTNFTFPLKFPSNSTFVAVMSDATGFGTGGTSSVLTVGSGHDETCFAQAQVMPEFFIFTNPPVPQECSPMHISYNTDASPPVDIFMVIPGGPSTRIESGSPKNMSFDWTPSFPAGTQMMLVAGDTTGMGKGGSTDILTVASGNSTSCLDTKTNTTTGPAPSHTSGVLASSLSLQTLALGLMALLFQ